MIGGMTSLPDLDQLTPAELRALLEQTLTLQSQVEAMSRKIRNDKIVIEQLTHEIAVLKRHKYAKRSEQISPEQGRLLDDLLNVDLEAIEAELNALHPDPAPKEPRQKPKRAPLPAPSFSASVKMSAKSSITRRACSRLSSMYVESGPAEVAKP